jgi:hypothetical protein
VTSSSGEAVIVFRAAIAVAATIPWEGAWAVKATSASFVCDVASLGQLKYSTGRAKTTDFFCCVEQDCDSYLRCVRFGR